MIDIKQLRIGYIDGSKRYQVTGQFTLGDLVKIDFTSGETPQSKRLLKARAILEQYGHDSQQYKEIKSGYDPKKTPKEALALDKNGRPLATFANLAHCPAIIPACNNTERKGGNLKTNLEQYFTGLIVFEFDGIAKEQATAILKAGLEAGSAVIGGYSISHGAWLCYYTPQKFPADRAAIKGWYKKAAAYVQEQVKAPCNVDFQNSDIITRCRYLSPDAIKTNFEHWSPLPEFEIKADIIPPGESGEPGESHDWEGWLYALSQPREHYRQAMFYAGWQAAAAGIELTAAINEVKKAVNGRNHQGPEQIPEQVKAGYSAYIGKFGLVEGLKQGKLYEGSPDSLAPVMVDRLFSLYRLNSRAASYSLVELKTGNTITGQPAKMLLDGRWRYIDNTGDKPKVGELSFLQALAKTNRGADFMTPVIYDYGQPANRLVYANEPDQDTPHQCYNARKQTRIESPLPAAMPPDLTENCRKVAAFIKNRFVRPQEFAFYVAWLADMASHPGRRCLTALVLMGDQGTGKTTLANIIPRAIFGESAFIGLDSNLSNKFSEQWQYKLIAAIEEYHQARNPELGHAQMAKIKTAITERRQNMELKGQNAFQVFTNCRFIFTTNDLAPFYEMGENERRFMIFSIPSIIADTVPGFEHGNCPPWYNQLLQAVGDKDGDNPPNPQQYAHCLLNELKAAAPGWERINPNKPQQTEQKQQLIQASYFKNPVVKIAFNILAKAKKDGQKITAAELYQLIRANRKSHEHDGEPDNIIYQQLNHCPFFKYTAVRENKVTIRSWRLSDQGELLTIEPGEQQEIAELAARDTD